MTPVHFGLFWFQHDNCKGCFCSVSFCESPLACDKLPITPVGNMFTSTMCYLVPRPGDYVLLQLTEFCKYIYSTN